MLTEKAATNTKLEGLAAELISRHFLNFLGRLHMEADYGNFIVNIVKTLKKNGFPEKRVSLPLEKMYEVAYEKGLNLNKVLAFLLEKEDIDHEKTDEKIIFFKKVALEPNGDAVKDFFNSQDFGDSPMSKMFSDAKSMIQGMSNEQIQGMLEMFKNMPQEEKARMMKQAQDFMKTDKE